MVLGAGVVAGVDGLARAARVAWSDGVLAGWGLFTAAREGRAVSAVRLPQMNRAGRVALTTPAMVVEAAAAVVRVGPSESVVGLVGRVRGEVREVVRRWVVAEEELARAWPAGVEAYYGLPQLNVKAFDYSYRFGAVTGRQETLASGPVGRADLSAYRDAVHGFR
nr:hypothetical protein [Micromonospora sp. DSM 115978]